MCIIVPKRKKEQLFKINFDFIVLRTLTHHTILNSERKSKEDIWWCFWGTGNHFLQDIIL
jgi:hypothetical protein